MTLVQLIVDINWTLKKENYNACSFSSRVAIQRLMSAVSK